jgi:deoxycytidine triphosphate deaminase
MILGSTRLLELVKTHNLVEGLSDRELYNPEGAGFDLRLGELYRICGEGFVGIEKRLTPKEELLAKYQPDKPTAVTVKPGDFYLVKTVERLNVPPFLTVNLKPRTTTFRSGITIRTGNVGPGYCGELVFALKNEGPCDVAIEMGARLVHAQFSLIEGESNSYRGQWQGGRVSTQGMEQQI